MLTRALGTSGLDVSAIGFSCMGLSDAYGLDVPEHDAINVIHEAVDLGVTFFDTAQVYGPLRQRGARWQSRRPRSCCRARRCRRSGAVP